MNRRRLMALTLSLYPSWWRQRYGAEAADILDHSPPGLGTAIDLVRGALDAWTHQRPPGRPFERFGDEALQVVVLAQKEAHVLHHDYVGTEHILLGLLATPDGIPTRALTGLGVTSEAVRARLLQVLSHGCDALLPTCSRKATCSDLPKWSMRLTPRAKRGFELASHAADRLGDDALQPGHLLLGLLDEAEGIGPMILAELVEPERVRARLAELGTP